MQAMDGTIKKLNPTFGFITGSDGVDRFFLPKWLQPSGGKAPDWNELREGQPVKFEHDDNDKGPRAKSVRVG